MSWSTRELAELAGTTVKAVRHYHDHGLLELPDRDANGYKRYEVGHLLRLLQVRRAVDLGVPLTAVQAWPHPQVDPDLAARNLDEALAALVDTLQRRRRDVVELLDGAAPETPGPFRALDPLMSQRDRTLALVLSRILGESQLQDLLRLADLPHPAEDELALLPEDADEETVERLARGLALEFRAAREAFPWMADLRQDSPLGPVAAEAAVVPTLVQLYHPAQLRVLARAHHLSNGPQDPVPPGR